MADSCHFFMAMERVPTATKQEHQVRVVRDARTGRHVPRFYPSRAWSDAESELRAHLEPHRPDEPIEGPVMLEVTWCFPLDGHEDGEPYLEKPDTDNLIKGLKDIMTELGWWADDATVFSDCSTKVHSKVTGVRVDVAAVQYG